MEFAIRRLTGTDAPVAQKLVCQFHDRELSVRHLEKTLADPVNYLVIAEVNDRLAGFLFAHRIDHLSRAGSQIFIYEIEVEPEFRRKGIGTALIDFILDVAQRDGIEAFVFTNHSNKGAVEFYKSTGGVVENGDDLLFVYPAAGDT